MNLPIIAAKAALRRKQQHAHSLEQTTAQIATLEQQIYSIEAANINQETLKAMQKAGKAMGQIHQGLTIDKVDQTMYVIVPFSPIKHLGNVVAREKYELTCLSAGTNFENNTP